MRKGIKKLVFFLLLTLVLPFFLQFAAGQRDGGSVYAAQTISRMDGGSVYEARTISRMDGGNVYEARAISAYKKNGKKDQDKKNQDQKSTGSTVKVDKNGSYDSKDEVALYIHTYGKLPSNYITKKQAQKLGWSGGSLEDYAEGKCIGGSYFGNNEGILPEDDEYHECDIDTLGKSKRGAKRIVFSDDGDIYYTEDHYESFILLYTAEGPVTEEIVYRAD